MPETVRAVERDSVDRLEALAPRGVRLGLEAISEILRRLGSPQKRMPRILIAGTNGKGSTAATLSSIFRAAGIRCGLHTSPHLADVCERVRVADSPVSRPCLARALDRVFAVAQEPPAVPVTYFEAVTAAAEVVFERERCSVAVVEVGLGGRLDATNASEPFLSLVTSIGLDHQADLGDSVEAIAREKAGIFRRGSLALCRARSEAALRVLEGEAARVGATFEDAESAARIAPAAGPAEAENFSLTTRRDRYVLNAPLPGEHQRENISLAVLAAEYLSDRFPEIGRGAIERGVAKVRWPGRLELFQAGGRNVWLDGCHNPDGAEAIGRFFSARGLEFDLLFGAMSDKDIEGIARPIFSGAARIYLAAPRLARAASVTELKARLSPIREDLEGASSAEEALARLLREPEARDILVAGSLYLVGEAREALLAEALTKVSA
jgi:dihydrofolate synthase/folylpolyglutamate synthase